MAIEYTPESSLVSDPAEGGSFSASNDAELAGAQSFAAKAKLAQIAAEQAETNAENSATSASGAASTASTFATNASNSATASANSATAAATSATNAANSATAASNSATDSANSATASAGSATDSANSATASAGSATASAGSATNSANSATASASSATDSANSATASAGSATAAAGSATAASGSATSASNSATDSANSATASASSATDSANSATASANSATAAAGSATAASNSETAAASSATDSANSATASANSATASAGSATSSSNSATSAATAQTAAEAARDAALAAFDSFDDRYLGQKSSDPSTDNDGDALVAGTLYFNTTTDVMMVYEGSSWVAAYASLSGALIANNNLSDLNNVATARTNLGLGTIATAASTDYVPTTGGTFTGEVESPEFIGTLQGEVVFKAKAGEAITKGDAVYVSGISGNTPLVSKADADDAAKMPAFGLSADTVALNGAMEVVILGQLNNIDTSGYALGDNLYVSNTPGALSTTKPTGESSQLQNIGKVERVHASTGAILVAGSGRSAATPNLNDGNFFLGDATNCSVATDFTTAVLGEISAGTGIGISVGGVISNSAPDQTVSLTGAGATTVSGTYPNFTITSTNTTYTAGTGITLTGTEFSIGQGVATTDSPTFDDGTFTGTLSITPTSGYANIELGGVDGAFIDLKSPSSDDYDMRMITSGGNGGTIDVGSTGDLSFNAGGSERARLLSTGEVGIGTNSPSTYGGKLNITDGAVGGESTLVIANNNANQFVRVGINDNVAQIAYDNADSLAFGEATDSTTAGLTTERMRIDSSGNVGIGTTTPTSNLEVSDSTQATGATLSITNSHEGSWVSGDKIGSIDFRIDDGSTSEKVRAKVHSEGKTTGTFPSNSDLVFSTTSGNTLSEAMRIDASGKVGIGTASPSAPLHIDSDTNPMIDLDNNTTGVVPQFRIYNPNTSNGYFGINTFGNTARFTQNSSTGSPGTFIWQQGTLGEKMRLNNQGRLGLGTTAPAEALHVVGSIVATGNITAYYSDERLKDLKGTIENPLEKLNTLNGYYYTPNEEAILEGAEWNGLEVGVSAQEVEKVLPEVIRPSAIGKGYKTVAYEKLTPLLIEAVKELSEKVDKLESRLNELEK